MAICQGDFLEEEYPWLLGIKHNLNSRVLEQIDGYVQVKLKEKTTSSLLERLVRLMLRLDPYSEKVAIYMIQTLGLQGKSREVELFYKSFEKILIEEMGEKPSRKLEETLRNVQKMFSDKG